MLRALLGTLHLVKFDPRIKVFVNSVIEKIDEAMSDQLAEVLHEPKFLQLEGAWRGLEHLVFKSDTGASIKICMLNTSKDRIREDLTSALRWDQSRLYKLLYTERIGLYGKDPIGMIVGDFEFSHNDLVTLKGMAKIAAVSFAPFIAAPSPELFGFDHWAELPEPMKLESTFLGEKYKEWNDFRENVEDSRYVVLAMPRLMARAPYAPANNPAGSAGFSRAFDEAPRSGDGESLRMLNGHYCWMNAAYAYAARVTDSFWETGWCLKTAGKEGGGEVCDLPRHVFRTVRGEPDAVGPGEVAVAHARSWELGKLGFLVGENDHRTATYVFVNSSTVQKPRDYGAANPAANENAQLMTMAQYIFASSRLAQCLKIMGHDKVGSLQEAEDYERSLNRWIMNYIDGNAEGERRYQFPFKEATMKVTPVPGKLGYYQVKAHIRPWLPLVQLHHEVMLVAELPKKQ